MTPLRIEESIDRLVIHPGRGTGRRSAQRLQPYLGTFIANYANFDNEEFTVKARNGKLVLDVPSQLAFELMEPDEEGYWAFAIAPEQVKVTFDRNENDEVVGLKLHKAGNVHEVPRKGTARAKELATRVDGQDSTITTWKGTLDARGNKLRLEIDIIEKAGKLTGRLRSLDQGNTTVQVTDVAVKGDSFRFSIQQISATFNGKYGKDRSVAKGMFSQNGVDLPLTLSKTATRESKSQGTLKEAWIGTLNMGGVKPVMQFRIVTLESGETAAYFDSVMEQRTDFDATWSIEGDKLNFDVASIKLKYRGTLNEAGDTAEGIWSQGGRDIPLTLKKHATEYDSDNVGKSADNG